MGLRGIGRAKGVSTATVGGWAFQTMATGFDLSHVCFAGRPAAATGQIARPAGCKSPAPSPTPLRADEPAHGFVGWVLDRSGLDASVYRHRPLLRRLPSCLRTLQVRSVAEGRALLENRPDLLPAAVGSLLIGVTEFFRDPAVFEAVRARVVPELAACRRGPLRIWMPAVPAARNSTAWPSS